MALRFGGNEGLESLERNWGLVKLDWEERSNSQANNGAKLSELADILLEF